MNDHSRLGLTQHIAHWAVNQARIGIPESLDHHVRRMTLDHLAGVVASSPRAVSQQVASHARSLYPGEVATAIGHGRLSTLGAAVVNGTNGHGVEADEGYTPGSMHPTSVILPAVFAIAQQIGSDATSVRTAAAIGMEASCRIAAAGHPATRHRHFHNTPLGGVFGAAIAVGILRGFDAHTMAHAIGIAGSHASGLFAFLADAAEVKRYHPGKASRDGIVSADLAASGLTGPTTVFEGVDGYFAAYAGTEGADWDPQTLTEGLGERWVLQDTYVKPYPCCRHLHGAIDAALELQQHVTLTDIDRIDVGTFGIAVKHAGKRLDSLLEAQLSLPFTVAVAFARGSVRLEDFAEAGRTDPTLLDLTERVHVALDAEADAAYPRSGRPAEVRVTLRDGSTLTHRVQYPYGEPANPLSDSALETKVAHLCEPVIGSDATSALIAAVWQFANIDFLDAVDTAVPRSPLPHH